MNRVYKVIWSKAKHCYVVTSEIARSVTKSASSARSAGRKGAAVLAMAALLFTAGGVLGEAANVTEIAVNEPGNVITVTKDDGKAPDTITINNVEKAKEAVHATAADRATRDGNGVVIDITYVKKADAEVDVDGNYVKTDKKVGENLSALDTQVKANADAVAAEETARKEADKGNLKVDPDGVISKVSNDDGSQPDSVNKLVLNVDGNNRITMDENGIKVGKNSTVIASDGVFAGGDTADAAKAALNANGSIKGANGKFTVDTNGLVTANGGVDTNSGDILTRGGKINAGSGDISGKDISASGDISGKDITGSGTVKGHAVTDGTARMEGGALTGVTTITAGGDVVSTGGKVQGTSVSDGTATLSGGSLNNAVDINASGTITGNNVVVKGKLTTNGLETDRITLGSETLNQTDINKGNVTSKVNDTVGAVEYTAESIFNKDGSSITARTDEGIVDSTGKSIVGAKEISQYLGNNAEPKSSDKNVTRNMVRNDDGTFSMEDKAVDEGNSSTVRQNAGERTVTVTDGENTASTNLTAADIKNTAENGMISNTAKNLVNTATENMTNTVGGNLTTTVTGDSSLTAENITNEAKNRITNKAIDVETDATSSIVQKVTNDAGSNTSTQWSYQTLEEMSQADGKTASYLRGAVEEKSQLTDGDKKTTIDTVAGQTNTNITDGTNTSNDLQKADQIASSVTKGTNKTVVNQDAVSLASSITDGTKVNNTNNTVDKSEQLIKADDTHFYAETRTAGSAVEALKSDGNTIISAKDAVTGTVSSAVTDGTNTTGSSMTANGITNSAAESIVNEIGDGSAVKSEMTAKGITNTAKDGTITNDAKDLVNTASNSITDKVGENVERTMGTKKIEESVKDGTKSNTFTKTAKKDMNIITDGTNTSTLSQLADKVNTSLKEVDGAGNTTKSLNNVKTVSEDTTKITDTTSGAFSSSSQKADSITSTVKDTEKGTISERSQTVSQVQDKVGTTTVTTTDGLTELTNKDRNHKTVMDYANVTKDLNVNGDATVDQKLTVKGDSDLQGNATVGKNLEVKGTSTLKGDVTMESNATVKKDLTVNGTSTFNDAVTITQHGLAVTGGTTTDTLNVTGETRTGTLHVNGDGYVGGNLNVDGNIETHDALLSADSRQVVTGRQLYQTNERVDRLDNRIKKVGANAAALAALRPGDFNPDDKFSIAAGFGSYRNANAAALGLFYRPNENVLLSLGTSFGDGENMVNAGVSVKFGRGKSMAERRKEMADEVSSMRDEMRSQDERIAELEEMLKKQSELIEKLSKES